MGKETPVLNWYAKESRLTTSLVDQLNEGHKAFSTIRRGNKWADRLNPDETVAISISDDPNFPNVVGYAIVLRVIKTNISILSEENLRNNIGAKNKHQVVEDMRAAYQDNMINEYSLISVIELLPIN